MTRRKKDPRERIVIEGELVRIEQIVLKRQVRLGDLENYMLRGVVLSTGMLPLHCCYYGQAATGGGGRDVRLYVIALPAHTQHMLYRPYRLRRLDTEEARNTVYSLEVSWPPTLWFFSFVDKSLCSIRARTFSGTLLEKCEDTIMCNTHLPNFNGGGSGDMCVGAIGADISLNFDKRLNYLMTALLKSNWNDDLNISYENTGVTDLLDWGNKSATNPSFWETMTFEPIISLGATETFKDLCAYMLRT